MIFEGVDLAHAFHAAPRSFLPLFKLSYNRPGRSTVSFTSVVVVSHSLPFALLLQPPLCFDVVDHVFKHLLRHDEAEQDDPQSGDGKHARFPPIH